MLDFTVLRSLDSPDPTQNSKLWVSTASRTPTEVTALLVSTAHLSSESQRFAMVGTIAQLH